ncbi:MAG: helix-turn-helix domain-containing protein, partial [Candidatus Krumholzibacteria bacterium]|nr:helix-turn-helix domain-containing protein [Candidatus Krumholzibacteria bacterium]
MLPLDPDACYRALRARDTRFDGRFFTGVVTTGVYCRPVCSARTPRRENVRFFACAAAAEAAGFRPCLRCRPDASPGTPAWAGTSATVSRALRLIDEGALDESGVDVLAARLGVTSRHLRRLFIEHLGAAPVAIAQARRVHFARALVDDTRLPITDIALGSGFASVRRFNHVFKRTFTRSPSEMRRFRSRNDHAAARGSAAAETGLALRLPFREPFDWDGMLAFLAPRAIPGIERVEGNAYHRVVTDGEAAGEISVRKARDERALVVSIPIALAPQARELAARTRRL